MKTPLVEDDLEALIAAVDRDTAETSDEDPLGGGEEVDQNMVDALLEEITASPGFESGREGETLAGWRDGRPHRWLAIHGREAFRPNGLPDRRN